MIVNQSCTRHGVMSVYMVCLEKHLNGEHSLNMPCDGDVFVGTPYCMVVIKKI
jgi:hypothetical protein